MRKDSPLLTHRVQDWHCYICALLHGVDIIIIIINLSAIHNILHLIQYY